MTASYLAPQSTQSARQASVRAVTGTSGTYEGDWHALFDLNSIPAGSFNERLHRYINLKLSRTYASLPEAMQAFASANGAANWSSLGAFSPAITLAIKQFATNSRIQDRIDQANTQMMARSTHVAAAAVNGEVEVEFANWIVTRTTGSGISLGNGTEIGPGAPLTVTGSIEYPAGTFTQLLFGGQTSGVATDGGYVVGKATIAIPYGARFWVRSYHLCSAGITNTNIQNGGNGELLNVGTTGIADQTMGGTITNGASGFIHRPVAIRASGINIPAAYLLGDSRVWGQGDTYGSPGTIGNLERGFVNTVPFINGGIRGDRMAFFLTNPTKRLDLMRRSVTDVVIELAINDFYRGSQTAASLEALQQQAVSLLSGFTIRETTKEPITTSTNSWTAPADQTVDVTINDGRLTAYNDWIRALPPGVTSVYEIADQVESARNSGFWKAKSGASFYTSDGVHETNFGYLAIPTGVTPVPFGISGAVLAISGSVPNGTVGVAYSFTPTISGGAGSNVVTLSAALPTGFTLNASTGVIANANPAGTSSYSGTMTVTDRAGATATLSVSFSIAVASPAVSIDATATASTVAGATSLTWSHTVGASANLMLVALGTAVNGDAGHTTDFPSATSITVAGVSMTKLDRAISTGQVSTSHNRMAEIWYLQNPPTGSVSIVLSTPQGSATATVSSAAASISFNDALAVSPLGSSSKVVTTTSGGATTESVNTTDATPGYTIAVASCRSTSAPTPGAGQTSIYAAASATNLCVMVTRQPNASPAASQVTIGVADQMALLTVAVKSN